MARRLATVLIALLAVAAPAASAAGLDSAQRVTATTAARASTGGGLIAPGAACPGQASLDAPVAAQESTMLCMVNYARAQLALRPLAATDALEFSARAKSEDVLTCDSFSHYACGRQFDYWIEASGYLSTECWRAGENLAFGSGSYGSVRSIFRAWMRSPEHRENILGDYAETGIDLVTGTLEGFAGTKVWTQHFGLHC